MKYDYELDLVSRNSLSILLEQIKSNTVILEFGPATGRLTRYLKEQLNCRVYLVELDEAAGRQALKYGEDLVCGDIEAYEWLRRYRDLRFDYLIFADVLEHLKKPKEVLIRAKQLLRPDGTVLLSVPNFAHNSVLIELLNDRLEYQPVGLLDDTHIRIFTQKSLESMLQQAGLIISGRFATYSKTGTNEIRNSIDGVEGIDRSFWQRRPYGEVYQFVYAAKKGREYVDAERNELLRPFRNFYAQLFTGVGEIGEAHSVKLYFEPAGGVRTLVFTVADCGKTIRLDPLNAPCVIWLKRAEAMTENGSREIRMRAVNARFCMGNLYFFDTEDPMLSGEAGFGERVISVVFFVRYLLLDGRKIRELCEALEENHDRECDYCRTSDQDLPAVSQTGRPDEGSV